MVAIGDSIYTHIRIDRIHRYVKDVVGKGKFTLQVKVIIQNESW